MILNHGHHTSDVIIRVVVKEKNSCFFSNVTGEVDFFYENFKNVIIVLNLNKTIFKK